MTRLLLTMAALTISVSACDRATAQVSVSSAADVATPTTEEEKVFYALGLAVAGSLSQFTMSEDEIALMKQGLSDALTGQEAAVDLATYQPRIAELGQSRAKAAAEKTKADSMTYMADLAKQPGAKSFESGLLMFELAAGDGPQPAATDTVQVHYHGTLTDGTVFDSSVDRGTPATFPLNRVIPCWTEGVQQMKTGGKSRLICPSDIAYGDRGSPPRIGPGATLIFEVELLGIEG